MKEKVALGPCCFCGQHIAPTSTDPCRLTVQTPGNQWQIWYCHERCFHDRIVTGAGLAKNGMEAR